MAVLASCDISAEETGLAGIVKIGQRLGFDIDAFAEQGFDLALRLVGSLARLTAKRPEDIARLRLRTGGRPSRAADLLVGVVGETQHEPPKALLDRVPVEDAPQVIGFGPVSGLQGK